MNAFSETIESVHAYREEGLQVFPIPFGEKAATIKHGTFQSQWIPKERIKSLFADQSNIAGLGGSISNNLAIFDVDNLEKFNNTLGKNKRFQEMRNSTWESYSASGRPHIFFRTASPIRTTNKTYHKLGFGTEIKAHGNYVLLPPSVFLKNGQGLLYTWKRRQGKILELNESETEELRQIIPFEYWTPTQRDQSKPFGMTWKLFDIICLGNFEKYGFKENGSPSRSEAEFHFLLYLINLGWTNATIIEFIQERANPKTRFKIRGSEHTLEEIRRARAWFQKHKSDSRIKIDKFNQAIRNFDWKSFSGRSAITDKLVSEYIGKVAIRTGKIESLSLPIREIAEQTGRGTQAVIKSLQRLRSENGLIELQRSSHFFHASEYSLKEVSPSLQSSTYGQEYDCCDNDTRPDHDSWRKSKSRRQSLLKTGQLVYEEIHRSNGTTSEALVSKLQSLISRKTVYRKIRHLKELGAIKKEGNNWIVCMSLDEISKRIDSEGQAEKQKDFHARERELQRKILEFSPEERSKAKLRFLYNSNKHLKRIGIDEWMNPKTGEVFSLN